MAIYSQQVTVGTSAVRLDPTTGGTIPQGSVAIRNRGSVPVYLGGPGVTTSNGLQVDAGESFTADLRPGDAIYGIAGSVGQRCDVIQLGGAG